MEKKMEKFKIKKNVKNVKNKNYLSFYLLFKIQKNE